MGDSGGQDTFGGGSSWDDGVHGDLSMSDGELELEALLMGMALSPPLKQPASWRDEAGTCEANIGARETSSLDLASTRQWSGGGGGSTQLSSVCMEKILKLQQKIAESRNDYVGLRQEACDLQEYSNAKINRVTRYLGVLLEKARKLDAAALDCEARVGPLRTEKRKLFNDLMSLKGNIRVFCRVRPQFEDEGPSAVAFPDNFTIKVSPTPPNVPASGPKKDYEFDRVYGPHVRQEDLFEDIQPLVQSVLDGYNVCIFAYGQTGSGKTHTMEGLSNDPGVYFRAFDELFQLAGTSATPTSKFTLHVSMLEIYNEQVRDLLAGVQQGGSTQKKLEIKHQDNGIVVDGLREERLDTAADFARALETGTKNRATGSTKANDRSSRSHLVMTLHVRFADTLTGEKYSSKLSLVDMAGSERLSKSEASGDRLTESLHINKSLSALGDVISALTAKKGHVPYRNSKLTHLLSDSLGGESKTLMIVNCSPSFNDVQETICSLNFAARARNVELSLGSRDTIKKWRDMANEARKEMYEKEKELSEVVAEDLRLKKSLQDADAQCILLFSELQKAWSLSLALQQDISSLESQVQKLKAEGGVMSQAQQGFAKRVEEEIAKRMEAEERFKLQVLQTQALHQSELKKLRGDIVQARVEKDTAVAAEHAAGEAVAATLKEKIRNLEDELAEMRRKVEDAEAKAEAAEAKAEAAESAAAAATMSAAMSATSPPPSLNNASAGDLEKLAKTASMNEKLEEELKKRDELIETLHKENEVLSEQLMEKSKETAMAAKPPLSRQESTRSEDSAGSWGDARSASSTISPHASTSGKANGTSIGSPRQNSRPPLGAPPVQVEKPKSTPAGTYLIDTLNQFQGEGPEHVEGANKGLMLVLAAVVKAGPSREHELLLEIREAVFGYLRKMELKQMLDPMFVSRVRILYIRSLVANSPELKTLKVPTIDKFLERPGPAGTPPRDSPMMSPASESGRSFDHGPKEPFRINIKGPERRRSTSWFKTKGNESASTKAMSLVEQRVQQLNQDAKNYAVGNKALAALLAHNQASDLHRHIRRFLAENFEFLSVTESADSGSAIQPEIDQLAQAVLDGWMAGLGTMQRSQTSMDTFGQVLSDYTKRVYTAQLQHLKDIAATLATEEADDMAQVLKLRTGLEAVDMKRRKVLHQMRHDPALLSKEEGGSPLRNPSTVSEDGRVSSLLILEDILKASEEVRREASMRAPMDSKRSVLVKKVEAMEAMLPSLQPIDHEVGEKAIAAARGAIEEEPSGSECSLPVPERTSSSDETSSRSSATLVRLSSAPARSYDSGGESQDSGPLVGPGGVPAQWTVVQFNNGTQAPVKVKCGASPDLELVVKAVNPDGSTDKVAILPVPATLNGLSSADMDAALVSVPETLRSLITSKTAEGTRARYSRLYKTLVARVPALKALSSESGGDETPFASSGRGGRFGFGSFSGLPSSMEPLTAPNDRDPWRRGSVDGGGGR